MVIENFELCLANFIKCFLRHAKHLGGALLNHHLTPTGVDALDSALNGGFPRGSLIVLAGNPGSGKTVFSARFLYKGAADYGEKGVYVSFCESRDAFMENMRGFGFDFERLEHEGLFRYLDLLTVKEQAVSTILNMIISEVEILGAKRLILDSFSAMAQAFKEPIDARIIIHTVLGKLIRSMGCTTILIEEVPHGNSRIGLGIEEFVADGVIQLKTDEINGYRLRKMEILKLRGVKLKEPRLVFTLEDGFKIIPQCKPKLPEKPARFQPLPDPPGKYSTGSESFDTVLGGGITKGSVMLLEIDEKVTTQNYHALLSPMAVNFVCQGRAVFIVPSSGVDPTKLRGQAAIYGTTEDEWKRYIRIILSEGYLFEEASPNVITVRGDDWAEDFAKATDAGLRLMAETGQPNLWIIGVDTLLNVYGEKDGETILNYAANLARIYNAALVAIIKAGYRDLAVRLSAVADVYLRMTRMHGALLLYGVKPRTGLYAVECNVEKGYPIAKLTPIL